jgi:hypothetical protein
LFDIRSLQRAAFDDHGAVRRRRDDVVVTPLTAVRFPECIKNRHGCLVDLEKLCSSDIVKLLIGESGGPS